MATQKRIESFFIAQSAAKRSRVSASDQPAENINNNETIPVQQDIKPQQVATLSPQQLHGFQIEEMGRLRAHANRNCALAKQVVIRSENSGTSLPALKDLLIEDSWRDLMADHFTMQYFSELERFVQGEWQSGKLVFPPKDSIFRAFNSCPVDKIRVVILGQDPYHDLGQAQGLSFSVPQGKQLPSSLRNIYKEMKDDIGCPIAHHGCLEKWANQGVLLLNAVLTVRAHEAASHAKRGWEKFTDTAIARLSKERSGLVFLLWGKYAQDKGKVIDRKKHVVLTSAHPSGLSAHRGFFGCRHFSQTNDHLVSKGELPIDWCIE